jgi:non-homologous end joining protein Ku
VPLGYQLWCEHGHGPFTADEARKAVVVHGALTPTTTEEVAEVKAPAVPAKTADLRVYPADQVEAATLPNGNMFRLRAEPTLTYGVLRELVADTSKAYVCEMVLKGKTCLYRAVVQRDTIVLVELVRPERMLPGFEVDVEVDERVLANARLLADALTEEFVPENWADERTLRMQEMGASGSEPTVSDDVAAATANLLALFKVA